MLFSVWGSGRREVGLSNIKDDRLWLAVRLGAANSKGVEHVNRWADLDAVIRSQDKGEKCQSRTTTVCGAGRDRTHNSCIIIVRLSLL